MKVRRTGRIPVSPTDNSMVSHNCSKCHYVACKGECGCSCMPKIVRTEIVLRPTKEQVIALQLARRDLMTAFGCRFYFQVVAYVGYEGVEQPIIAISKGSETEIAAVKGWEALGPFLYGFRTAVLY